VMQAVIGFGVDVSLIEIENLSDRLHEYTSAIATCNIQEKSQTKGISQKRPSPCPDFIPEQMHLAFDPKTIKYTNRMSSCSALRNASHDISR